MFHYIAATEEINDHIFDVITKLWSNKRQTNEDFVYNHILRTVKVITATQLGGGTLI